MEITEFSFDGYTPSSYVKSRRFHLAYLKFMKIASLVALFVFMGISAWTAQMIYALGQLPWVSYILN